jgi:hypothetical protein
MDELTQHRVAPPPDESHYQEVVEESDRLVVFLGADVNADDREEPWHEGSECLPDDQELAKYLADHVNWSQVPLDLAEVAQRVRTFRGDGRMFPWIRQVLAVDTQPGAVQMALAGLPERLEQAQGEKHYPMIVTPTYDLALERALRAKSQPFDVAVYVGRGAEFDGRAVSEEPCFVHLPWDSEYLDPKDVADWDGHSPIPIAVGNQYNSFPIINGPNGGELKRTVIVRVNGAVDDAAAGFPWMKNYVITEDHYIDYLSDRAAEEVIPGQILAQLRDSCYLFLGYAIADWRLRVFLKRIWGKSETLGSAPHWAIERDPDELEKRLWTHFRVGLYQSRLTDYVKGLDDYLGSGSGDA